MESLEAKNRNEYKGKHSEYEVRVIYGTEKLENCIRNLMKSMSQKEEPYGEEI